MEFLEIDSKNIYTSLLYIVNFIRSRKVVNSRANNVFELTGFGKAAWSFISSIYKAGWNSLPANKNINSLRLKVASKFTPTTLKINLASTLGKSKDKAAEIFRLSYLITAHLPKKVLEKSKFFRKRRNTITKAKTNTKQSYAQAANLKITDILKLKENYLNLPAKKIENIHRIINNMNKSKPHIKMTTKGLLQKQVIVPMSRANVDKIMALSSIHVTNINRALKNIKSNIMVDYIQPETTGVTIITNNIASAADLQVIEKYVKNVKNIISEDIQALRLPQSKSYLKIIGILYLIENTNIPINSDFIELVIKSSHIFNDLSLTSKPRIIKALYKSDITVVWIDIWDTQRDKNAKIIDASILEATLLLSVEQT